MQLAQANPDIYDLPELNRQMLDVLGIKNAEKLIPNKDEAKPVDPVSENMNIINGKPVKAFIYQDHKAHITAHMAFADDPKIRQLVGQSSKAGIIQAAMEAHIAEHIAFEYRKQLEEQLGAELPNPQEVLPEDVEVDLSRLVAQASEKLLQKGVAEAKQQQIQQQEEDPILQMQRKELEIKQLEAQAKAQKMQADTQLEQARLELDRLRLESDERIAGAKIGANAIMDNRKVTSQELIAGTKIGIDAVENEKTRQLSQTKRKESE